MNNRDRGYDSKVCIKYIKIGSKVGASSLLVAVLVYQIGVESLIEQMRSADPILLIWSMVILFISNLLQAWQWKLLLNAQKVYLSWSDTIVSYLAGIFFNNFLPANIGGEVLKIYDIGRKTGKRKAVFAATFFDRLLGMLILAGLALFFSFFALRISQLNGIILLIAVFFLATIIGVFLLLNSRTSQWMVDIINRASRNMAGNRIQSIRDAIFLYSDKIPFLRWLTILSLAIQLLRISTHYIIALSLGINYISGLYFFIFIPILGVLMLMPVSISGFGVREGAGILLFANVGVPSAHAFSIEFIAGIVNLATALIGGVVFLFKND